MSGKKNKILHVMGQLKNVQDSVKNGNLEEAEIPILQRVTHRIEKVDKNTMQDTVGVRGDIKASSSDIGICVGGELSSFEEALSDRGVYEDYSDVVLRSFPFSDILEKIKQLLGGLNLKRLFIFFDDFSELNWTTQRLFVDVILSPLNNSSDERVKLKVAGYPGRVYYGRIDPGKIDTISLDFTDLFKGHDLQSAEEDAVTYTTRLLSHRFRVFGVNIENYFESASTIAESMRVMFEVTFNVPRLMGYILKYCYLNKVVKNRKITSGDIKLASSKYYDEVLVNYFDRRNRYALEPFEQKLDRQNQLDLLKAIVSEAKSVRRDISTGKVGGKFFSDLSNPPVSHFSCDPSLEKVLFSLELNFLLTRYHQMRDKDGKDVIIYALYYGLCDKERIPWGYPTGRRDDRSYFVQRCFNFNSAIHKYLAQKETIRCLNCGSAFPIDKLKDFEFFKWKCPECENGRCQVVKLSDEYQPEIRSLDQALMLPETDIEILEVLCQENRSMRAKDISSFIDVSYQMIGKRTDILQQKGLVSKESVANITWNTLTEKGKDTYFPNTVN